MPQLNSERLPQVRASLNRVNQGHLLAHWEALNEDQNFAHEMGFFNARGFIILVLDLALIYFHNVYRVVQHLILGDMKGKIHPSLRPYYEMGAERGKAGKAQDVF